MKRGPLLLKTIALFLLPIYASTQCVFAYSPETNFWKERQAAVSRHPGESRGPVINLDSGVRRNDGLNQFGTYRSPLPQTNGKPAILHIQDVHLNAEAQTNISKAVQVLLQNQQVDLIALEGAFGGIDLSLFKRFPNQAAVHQAAAVLLEKQKIAGPVHALLRADGKPVPIVGVDDPTHYDANVEAYRQAAKHAPREKERIASLEKDLAAQKKSVFNGALVAFDKEVSAYRSGALAFGQYAKIVSAGAAPSPVLRQFLDALALEETLDWNAVEAERNRVLTHLFQTANEADRAALAEASVAYRAGRLSQTDFYAQFVSLCRLSGVDFTKTPALNAYVRYLTLSNSIDSEALFADLHRLEAAAYQRLAKTETERALVEQSMRLHLTAKLVDFSLTKQEWSDYKKIRDSQFVIRGYDELRTTSYEQFYEEAEIRDRKMADNLFAAMKAHGAKSAALVAGGFHAQGLRDAAKEFSYVSFVPKLTRIDLKNSSAYLSVFAQEKSPLEKLLNGEKLFLAPPVWDAPTRAAIAAEVISRNKQSAAPAGSDAVEELRSELDALPVTVTSQGKIKEEKYNVSIFKRSLVVFGFVAMFAAGFWTTNITVDALTGFNIWGWYTGLLSNPGSWESSLAAAFAAVMSGVSSRLAGIYISGSDARQTLLKDIGFFLFFAVVWRPVHGIFTDWIYFWIDNNIPETSADNTTALIRVFVTMGYGYVMSFIYEMVEPIFKFKRAARDAEKIGNHELAASLREQAKAANQWRRVSAGMFGRLSFAFTQNNLTVNWIDPAYRIPFVFGLGFLNQTFRATSSYFTGPRVPPVYVLLSGLGFSIFNFWLVSFEMGFVAVGLSITAYLYFTRRNAREADKALKATAILLLGWGAWSMGPEAITAFTLAVIGLVSANGGTGSGRDDLPPIRSLLDTAVQQLKGAKHKAAESIDAMVADFTYQFLKHGTRTFTNSPNAFAVKPTEPNIPGLFVNVQLLRQLMLEARKFTGIEPLYNDILQAYVRVALVEQNVYYENVESLQSVLDDSESVASNFHLERAKLAVAGAVSLDTLAFMAARKQMLHEGWTADYLKKMSSILRGTVLGAHLKKRYDYMSHYDALLARYERERVPRQVVLEKIYLPSARAKTGGALSDIVHQIAMAEGSGPDAFAFVHSPHYIDSFLNTADPIHQSNEDIAMEFIIDVVNEFERDLNENQRRRLHRMLKFFIRVHSHSPEMATTASETGVGLELLESGHLVLKANFDRIAKAFNDAPKNDADADEYLNALRLVLMGRLIEHANSYARAPTLAGVSSKTRELYESDDLPRPGINTARTLLATVTHITASGFFRMNEFFDANNMGVGHMENLRRRFPATTLAGLLEPLIDMRTHFNMMINDGMRVTTAARRVIFSHLFIPMVKQPPTFPFARLVHHTMEHEITLGHIGVESDEVILTQDAFIFINDPKYHIPVRGGGWTGLLPIWRPLIRKTNIEAIKNRNKYAPHMMAAALGAAEELFFSLALVAGGAWAAQLLGISFFDALRLVSIVTGIFFVSLHVDKAFHWKDGLLVRGAPSTIAVFVISSALRLTFAYLYLNHDLLSALIGVAFVHAFYNAVLSPFIPGAPLGIASNGGNGGHGGDEHKPNPDNVDAIRLLREAIIELKNEKHELADSVVRMWVDFEKLFRVPKNAKALIIPSEGEIMEMGQGHDGQVFLRVNIPDINRLYRDQEHFDPADRAGYLMMVKDYLKATLLEQSHYYRHPQEILDIHERIQAFAQEENVPGSSGRAQALLVDQISLEADSLKLGLAYLNKHGWDTDFLFEIHERTSEILFGDLLHGAARFSAAFDVTYEFRENAADAAKEAVLINYLEAAYYSEDPRAHLVPINKLVRYVAQMEENAGRLQFTDTNFEFTKDAFSFLFKDGNGEQSGGMKLFSVAPLLGLIEPTVTLFSAIALFGVGLIFLTVWTVRKLRKNMQKDAPRTIYQDAAKDLVSMASIASAHPNKSIAEIVDEFFKNAPLKLGLGSPTTTESDWATLFADPEFMEALRTTDNSHVTLEKARANALVGTLLRTGDKYKADESAQKNMVYILKNPKDTAELEALAGKMTSHTHLTVIVDEAVFGPELIGRVAPLFNKGNVLFHAAPLAFFVSRDFLHISKIKNELPARAQMNWENLTIITPTGLTADLAALSQDEMEKLRVQTIKDFLLGHAALTILDHILLHDIAAILVTRRQA